MRIIITGSSGMLGRALCQVLNKEHEVIGLHRKPQPSSHSDVICDITDKSAVNRVCDSKPDVIIHTAAKTNVDACELNPDEAYKINARGTENIAKATQKAKATLIYLSTDYVFDGEKGADYTEDDKPNPISVYGMSKFEGEVVVKKLTHPYFIIRTSCLFGEGRTNFVSTVVDLMKNRKRINVWQDQIGSPTYTKDLAMAIYKIVQGERIKGGIYHIANTGSCSRYMLAEKVLEYFKIDDIILNPIRCRDDERPAKRPLYSALDNSKYQATFGVGLRGWDAALKEYLDNAGTKG